MEEKNKIVYFDFRNKRKQNPKIVALLNDSEKRSKGIIKDDNHLLPPGPECYSEEEIILHIKMAFEYYEPRLIEGYKKANDHIFSCKRCRSLFFITSQKMADEQYSK